MSLCEYREAADGELALVYNSWMESYWQSAREALRARRGHYNEGHRALIDAALGRGARVRVAALHGTVVSWACIEAGALHYCYTKSAYRQQGVLAELLRRAGRPAHHTHETPMLCRALRASEHRPYLFFRPS